MSALETEIVDICLRRLMMRTIFKNCLIATFSIFTSVSAVAQVANSSVPPHAIPRALSLAIALETAQQAVALCAAKGFKVAVSVVDAEGGVKMLMVADGLSTKLGEFATRKALTSVFFKLPTSVIAQQVKTDQSLAAKIASEPNKFFTFPGGVPLLVNNELIGAVGVGGASDSLEDEKCATDAVAKIHDRL
jgi:uncharacterized protein GlcG (DUF336 family)